MIESFLLLAFIITNVGWLVFFHLRSESDRAERRELQNRIAYPKALIQEPDNNFEDEISKLQDHAELAAVGQINPSGLKREEKE